MDLLQEEMKNKGCSGRRWSELHQLKELKGYNIIPSDNAYASEDWYIYVVPILSKFLFRNYGKREVIVDSDLFFDNIDKVKDGTFIEDALVDDVKDSIDTLFLSNNLNYQKIYESVTAEFNPLWNVDGTESLTYTKENDGIQRNVNVKSGSISDNTSYTGTKQNTNVKSGSVDDDVSYLGSESNVRTGSVVNSNTTFESATFNDATKETNDNVTDTHSFNSRSDNHSTTFNNVTDTNTESFTNRADNRTETYNNVQDSATRTDDLLETYRETKERHGNIGVTKSTELIADAIELRLKYNFVEIVAKDIINMICFMC